MKNKVLIMAMFCLLFAVGAVSAQEKKMANFAGDWELDVNKSKLDERSRLESMTMKVTQTETDLTITATAKRAESAEGEGRNGRGGFGRGRGMQGDDSNQSTIYKLDGTETAIDSPGQFGGETKFKAESIKGDKMKLIQIRNLETPRGAMTVKTIETWELLDGGKTLKVVREMETPRGTRFSEMIFTKK